MNYEQVIIAGKGKLATELFNSLQTPELLKKSSWKNNEMDNVCSIIIHAGSGRELPEIVSFCKTTNSTLIELSTDSVLEGEQQSFPIVMCPNTNILMLKFMNMIAKSGHLFSGCEVEIMESHQSSKKSTPGTAVAIAQSLSVNPNLIKSVRDPEDQKNLLNIEEKHLHRHAFHSIRIVDGLCQIGLESKVFGESPYASGVSKIINATFSNALENRTYSINEYIENGWV